MSAAKIKVMGNPLTDQKGFEQRNMVLWEVPKEIRNLILVLPKKIYCNKRIVAPLEAAFRACIAAGVHTEIRTWDGCFNVRKMRQSNVLSDHAFGTSIDMNAAWNPLKVVGALDRNALRSVVVTWTEPFLDCWRRVGWNCGADWQTRLDGMHFQWDEL